VKKITGPIPKYIDFGFHKILIQVIGTARMREEAECQEGEETPEGLWDTDIDTIFLLRGMSRKKQRYYLMHEAVHAALDLMDSIDRTP
jgi:hypothetical protein